MNHDTYYLKLWKNEIIFNFFVLTRFTVLFPIELIHLINWDYLYCKINDKSYIISCGLSHTIALINNTLYACGNNCWGQLGTTFIDMDNHYRVPKFTRISTPFNPNTIKSIACGHGFTVLLSKNKLWCCGHNTFGQLGLGDSDHRYRFNRIDALDNTVFKEVFCGDNRIFVLTNTNLLCCGDNSSGQLGLEEKRRPLLLTPTLTSIPVSTIRLVTCGVYHTFVLTDCGLWGAGSNGYGQLGLPESISNKYKFEKLSFAPPSSYIVSVACGGHHSLLLTTVGLFSCGCNDEYQLGLGNNINYYEFTIIRDFDYKIISISCGNLCSFVLTSEGLLGVGRVNMIPVGLVVFTKIHIDCLNNRFIPGDSYYISKFISGSNHSFVITKYGTLSCGVNTNGELGQDNIDLTGYSKFNYRLIKFG